MIQTVVNDAILRDGKTAVCVGDLVRIEMNTNLWQVVAISDFYYSEKDLKGNVVSCEPYRLYMCRKLFNKKGVFKPSQYAEQVHQGWIYKPRADKLLEFEKYFKDNPEDKKIAYDLSNVIPEVSGFVEGYLKFNGIEPQVALEEMRKEMGYPLYNANYYKVIEKWKKFKKIEIGKVSLEFDENIKITHPYRLFVCGYAGYTDKNGEAIFVTIGLENAAEQKMYWFNEGNARKAIKEVGKENNGVHYVFR